MVSTRISRSATEARYLSRLSPQAARAEAPELPMGALYLNTGRSASLAKYSIRLALAATPGKRYGRR